MTTHMTSSKDAAEKVLPFDADRVRPRRPPSSRGEDERKVVAVVSVTRFIGEQRVHAQVPVFADEVHPAVTTRAELKHVVPELPELLADAAVEANAYLDRLTASRFARPITDFYSRR